MSAVHEAVGGPKVTVSSCTIRRTVQLQLELQRERKEREANRDKFLLFLSIAVDRLEKEEVEVVVE